MASNDTKAANKFFYLNPSKKQMVNNRIATRYIRKDITVILSKNSLLNFAREIPVDLIDISSKGVLIRSHKKLNIRDKITLKLKFDRGKTFKIEGTVVRKSTLSNIRYGIKFNRYNDELGDYLLETQKELIFR
ncbi:PilZ domain-containing protein [Methylobacter luteus]|uniref:PilZ domain-containing protein n=1 Tax=Methylobacter luteus TaxID=415 RepID=UPI0004877F72|nr:PilZ domain-containing protein [Methylobacter luteus]